MPRAHRTTFFERIEPHLKRQILPILKFNSPCSQHQQATLDGRRSLGPNCPQNTVPLSARNPAFPVTRIPPPTRVTFKQRMRVTRDSGTPFHRYFSIQHVITTNVPVYAETRGFASRATAFSLFVDPTIWLDVEQLLTMEGNPIAVLETFHG